VRVLGSVELSRYLLKNVNLPEHTETTCWPNYQTSRTNG